MSPGFCSFIDITVLTIQLVALFHSRNDPSIASSEFSISKKQRYNLKTLARLFQIAIHFHPGHPQLIILWVLMIRMILLAYQGVAKNN